MNDKPQSNNLRAVKDQILLALRHPEAEEGLYFRNLSHLHEEDERPAVEAPETQVLEALNQLVQEGKIVIDKSAEEVVFHIARS